MVYLSWNDNSSTYSFGIWARHMMLQIKHASPERMYKNHKTYHSDSDSITTSSKVFTIYVLD